MNTHRVSIDVGRVLGSIDLWMLIKLYDFPSRCSVDRYSKTEIRGTDKEFSFHPPHQCTQFLHADSYVECVVERIPGRSKLTSDSEKPFRRVSPDSFHAANCSEPIHRSGWVSPVAETSKSFYGQRRTGTSHVNSRRIWNHGWDGHTGKTITKLAFLS